jgi:hypothetical protein
MSRHTLLAMTFTLALVVLQPSAYAQAAAESALLGAGSSTATVKAGSALNSILNQGSKQLAGRVQRQVLQPTPGTISHVGARQVPTSRIKGTPVRAGTTPTVGPVIASIQGAVTGCVPTNQTPSALGSSAAAESVQTNCGGQDSASPPVPPEYKSVITLSFPKR